MATLVLGATLLLGAMTVVGQEGTPADAEASTIGLTDEVLTFELAAELAVAADNQVAVVERRLQEQLVDLGISGYLDDISLRLSGSVTGDADTALTGSGSAALSAGIEIIPQLTVNGTLSATTGSTGGAGVPEPLTGTIGLTLDPLADPTGRDRAGLVAEATATDLAAASASAAFRAIGYLIDAISAQMDLELFILQQEIAQRSLANTSALYDRDRATDQQMASAEEDVRTGTARVVRAELSLDRTRSVLARAVGSDSESIRIPAGDEMNLDSSIDAALIRRETVSAVELGAEDVAVTRAAQEILSVRLDLESAHRFSPRLSLSASGSLPNWQYSVTAELTVSPADWDRTAVDDAAADLKFAEGEYDYTIQIAEFDALSALDELQFSLDDLTAAQDDLSLAQQDLIEAEFRFSRGDVTQLTLEQSELLVTTTEHGVTKAMLTIVRRLAAIEYGQY